MAVTVRSRTLEVLPFHGEYKHWITSLSGPRDSTLATHQFTESEGHPWPRERRTGKDVGGPFDTLKTSYRFRYDARRSYTAGAVGTDWYVGQMYPMTMPVFGPSTTKAQYVQSFGETPLGTLNAWGAKAIAETIPTNPLVDGSVAVAELMREGLPSIIGGALLKNRMAVLRGAGSEYLNWEFGWKPLIKDLQAASGAILETEKHLLQLQRDSGKQVRRRRTFDTVFNSEVLTEGSTTLFPWPTLKTAIWSQTGCRHLVETQQKMWFSGAYTFHYDPGDLSEISRIATQARLLYGVKIDPDALWNLAPWSWLVDWVSSVGPVMNNLSAFAQDGLVLRYGYLMEETIRRSTGTHSNVTSAYTYDGPRNFSATHTMVRKRRIRASPFGFGLLMSSFTTRQLAILAALGMTR